jgi:hypothetical protein
VSEPGLSRGRRTSRALVATEQVLREQVFPVVIEELRKVGMPQSEIDKAYRDIAASAPAPAKKKDDFERFMKGLDGPLN